MTYNWSEWELENEKKSFVFWFDVDDDRREKLSFLEGI
jgi:hypothetical protein